MCRDHCLSPGRGHTAWEAWLVHLLAGQGRSPGTVAAVGDCASLLQKARGLAQVVPAPG